MSAGSASTGPADIGKRQSGNQNFLRRASMYTILLVLLILMLLGALPTWPYSRAWGYYPSGGLGLIVVVVLVLLLAGRL
jgi:sterol desaturase/sphingolipid hydroxylase (fatty acid hydroxylase superfamily)